MAVKHRDHMPWHTAGVLNRAEWIKFLGLFFNQDALASQIFDNINTTYHETAAEIQARPIHTLHCQQSI